MTPRHQLDAIFTADRAADEAEARLLGTDDPGALAACLREAVDEALVADDRAFASRRLQRLADLCAQVPGPQMVDALVAILGDEDAAVRLAAGEALIDVGYERYAEVARAVERALDAPMRGPAMAELPWILVEIAEPSAFGLLRRFLAHPEAEAVAAAIEALASLGDPAAIEAIEPLRSDRRRVVLDDLEQETQATIGELSEAAIEELGAGRAG